MYPAQVFPVEVGVVTAAVPPGGMVELRAAGPVRVLVPVPCAEPHAAVVGEAVPGRARVTRHLQLVPGRRRADCNNVTTCLLLLL